MSEFIEIEIRLVPVYGSGGLRSKFPALVDLLEEYGYTLVLDREPTLYHLVDVLVRIRNDPAVPDRRKGAVTRLADRFVRIRDEAREHLLGRRLNELDKTLYTLEDLFRELDRELR
ncbi:MAG: hypothetical protein HPY84_12620 [Syntrophobacteraceae bacterium]|nr:hypothetical protein [Syntrophobacteraceae bacterium]